ncbi:DivIVA domain-containing protein [Motilibacter rhizosphaerae]|uniref:DivIVA domain-containing protein n=1 Tax=Motilibacter rhizosphaerae TaxID=598652 RepID=A0A4Q7NQ61_9ACTN|nr:DivIVA domain-containing protein [Motilibacter rhizosphaerae]RZS87252.1 DivIVA domain-containing protein [Motilibacter rhizosphaerae]
MKVVFLLLLLAIVAGVALVAAGRGTSLSEVEPDAPPVGLPQGPLAPDDLHQVRFPSALRGYRMREVDEVLDRLAEELGRRDERIAELEGAVPPRRPEEHVPTTSSTTPTATTDLTKGEG